MSCNAEYSVVIPDEWFPYFCPKCGQHITNRDTARVVNPPAGKRVPGLCSRGHETWVSPSPVTVGFVFWCDSAGKTYILIVKRGIDPRRGMWAFVAGFMEPGQSAQETVKREALEEAGLDLRDARGTILDQLPSPNNPMLILTFIGILVQESGDAPTLTPDDAETLAAQWLPLDTLTTDNPELPWAFPWQLELAHRAARELGLR